MTSAFRALRSLLIPGMLGVFVLSIIITLGVLFGFIGFSSTLSVWAAQHVQEDSFLAVYLPWLGSAASVVIAWVLFPGIMPVIVNFFDDRIARLIEQKDYPAAVPAQPQSFLPELLHDARFSAMVILLNILALPFYLFPVLGQLLFFGLNGYLLGREFFVMVARRHLPIAEAVALRGRHAGSVFITGVALTLFATIPILNLFAPFWAIAVMVHLYHQLSAAAPPDIFSSPL